MKLPVPKNPETKTLLTKQINERFKILFDYRIEENYKISTIDIIKHPYKNRYLNKMEKANLYKDLCLFIEDATNLTYTEVEEKYGRKRDKMDKAVDILFPEEEFSMSHYSLAQTGIGKTARIHGFLRNGIFVVKRIDWGHRYHQKAKRMTE